MPLTNYNQKKEWRLIQNTAQNNNFPPHIIDDLRNAIKKRHLNSKETEQENKQWSTFTYYSPAVRTITNIFKHTNLRIAYKATNTIKQQTTNHRNNNSLNHNKSGIYKITYRTCNKAYIGQTSRPLQPDTKNTPDISRTNHNWHTPYIYSKTDMNTAVLIIP